MELLSNERLYPHRDQVLRMLLDGENEKLAALRRQLEKADVSSREMTGVGFYTYLAIGSDVERIPGSPSFKLGDVNGVAANVNHGVGFLLYVKDGALDMLEGYTYDEPWPSELKGLKLAYSTGAKRGIGALKHLSS